MLPLASQEHQLCQECRRRVQQQLSRRMSMGVNPLASKPPPSHRSKTPPDALGPQPSSQELRLMDRQPFIKDLAKLLHPIRHTLQRGYRQSINQGGIVIGRRSKRIFNDYTYLVRPHQLIQRSRRLLGQRARRAIQTRSNLVDQVTPLRGGLLQQPPQLRAPELLGVISKNTKVKAIQHTRMTPGNRVLSHRQVRVILSASPKRNRSRSRPLPAPALHPLHRCQKDGLRTSTQIQASTITYIYLLNRRSGSFQKAPLPLILTNLHLQQPVTLAVVDCSHQDSAHLGPNL